MYHRCDLYCSQVLYIHCSIGHGRSGTVCAALLGMLYSMSAKENTRTHTNIPQCKVRYTSHHTCGVAYVLRSLIYVHIRIHIHTYIHIYMYISGRRQRRHALHRLHRSRCNKWSDCFRARTLRQVLDPRTDTRQCMCVCVCVCVCIIALTAC